MIDNDLPASGSRVEERRGHRAPPQEAKEKDRKELGVGLKYFSSDRTLFSPHRGIKRTGRTSNLGGDRRTPRWLQRRSSPPRRGNLTLPEVQPHCPLRPILLVLQLRDPLLSPHQKKESSPPCRRRLTFLAGESQIDLRRDSRSPLAVRFPTLLVR